MNGEERFNKFVEDIENWIQGVGRLKIERNEEVEKYLNLDIAQLKRLSSEECNIGAYCLTAYAEYLQNVLAKEKMALEWADDGIWYIISDKLNNYGGQYAKWQEKYYSAIKENPIAKEMTRVKINAQARITSVEHSIENTKKLSEILLNLSRRR